MVTQLDIQPQCYEGEPGETIFYTPVHDIAANLEDRFSPDGLLSTLSRMQNYKDERSKVLLAALASEFVLDKVLEALLPQYRKVFDDDRDMTFSMKIKLLKASAVVPLHLTEAADCIRAVRNKFAHKLTIEKLDDLPKDIKNKMLKFYARRGIVPKEKSTDLPHVFDAITHIATESLSAYLPLVRDLNEAIRQPKFEEKIRKNAERRQKEQMKILLKHVNAPASEKSEPFPY